MNTVTEQTSPPPSPRPPRGPRLWVMLLVVIGLAAGFGIGAMWGGPIISRVWGWASARSRADAQPQGESASAPEAPQYYTCGMHPWVILPEPGLCPICHMDLIPLDPAKFKAEVTIDPAMTQNIGVRLSPVVSGPVARTIRTVGSVTYDETRVRDVNVKVAGWIEKLFVDYEGAPVEAGEPLFTFYSPQLYAAQTDYLSALRMRGARGAEALPGSVLDVDQLVRDARVQLEYYDVTAEQIDEIEQRGEASKTLTITSPFSGVVVAKRANEGMRVEPGMRVFQIADLSKIWVQVSLYEYQLPFIGEGQAATMTLPYMPGQTFEGRVIYIYPYLDEQTRQVSVRLEFDNPRGLLKPGMFASVELHSALEGERTLAPRSAIIDTGKRRVAFVSLGDGRFEPRDVAMGVQTDDGMVEILSGLNIGEEVVTSGQFLLDSEANMRENLSRMISGQGAGETEPQSEPHPSLLREPEQGEMLEPYPLEMCVVSDARLGSMGEPIRRAYEGRELLFCCESCLLKFEADPQKYLDQIDSAAGGGDQ